MKKLWFWLLIGVSGFYLFPNLSAGEDLKSGEAAIFRMGGRLTIGEIVDISSTRLVLQLKDGEEIPLDRVWIINFINTEWNFPEERKKMEKNENYLFFKNDEITSGRIIDFSSAQHVFEFDTGEKVPIGRVRRIYFSREIPAPYLAILPKEQGQEKPNFSGTYRGEVALTQGVVRTVTLTLNDNKTAVLHQEYQGGNMPMTQQGSWSENPDGTITLRLVNPGRIRRLSQPLLVFKLENNELVATQYDQYVWGAGGLKLKKI